MANVFAAATYILEKQGSMSAMKLQKLCYYAQAWSLVWDENELFPEDFQAWANGPVCPELYQQTKGKYKIEVNDEAGRANGALTDNQKETIDKVLEFYDPHDAQWLSRLTHMEDPWLKARQGVQVGAICNNIILKADMAEYYGGL
jgi:uncharacterized phage-associated protein